MIAVFSAEILPEDDDTEGLEDTKLWRVSFGYIPIFLYAFQTIMMLTYLRYDSIKFLIVTDNIPEAR